MQLQGVNYNALPMPMIQHQDYACQSEASATAEQVHLRTYVLAASQGILKKFTVAEESAVQVESQCLDRDEPILAEQEQLASTAESEPESAPPDQMWKLRDLTERIEICSNPNADRDMTLDEKSKLTACIASLNEFELSKCWRLSCGRSQILQECSAHHAPSSSFICQVFIHSLGQSSIHPCSHPSIHLPLSFITCLPQGSGTHSPACY